MTEIKPYMTKVHPDWIDYNGHMNVAYYVLAFDLACDHFLEQAGMGKVYRECHNCSFFVVESHVTYDREVLEGDDLRIDISVLGVDPKRLHLALNMYHHETGDLSATLETMVLHMDMSTRRTAPLPQTIFDQLVALKESTQRNKDIKPGGRAIRLLD